MNSNEVNTNEQPPDNQDVSVDEDENRGKKKKSKKEKQKNKKNKKNDKKKQDDKENRQEAGPTESKTPEENNNKKKKKKKEIKKTSKKSVASEDKINPEVEQSIDEKVPVELCAETDDTLPSSSNKNTKEKYLNDKLARIKADLENLQNSHEKKMMDIEDIRKQKESILAQQKKLKMEYEEWKLRQVQQHKEFKRKTKDEIKERQMQLKNEHERWKQKQKEKRRDTKRRLKEEYRDRRRRRRSMESFNSDSDSLSSSESVGKVSSKKSRTLLRNRSTSISSRGQVRNFFSGVAHSMYRTLGIRKAWRYIKKRVTRKVLRRALRICVKKTRKAAHFLTYLVTNYYHFLILTVLVVFSTYLIFVRKGAAPLEPG